ncbi:hypothetical protein PsorP6_007919 [Peronosclerospora sorghi]|uniref:Uncharacterized protein n=1 Tax=Peronosclerospora sorghi TaxID=230839 RepID=A0ACC0WB54_9STRA|nr:hypothetical protein PsorP6_007919 [Peronosclerospora sorghi]
MQPKVDKALISRACLGSPSGHDYIENVLRSDVELTSRVDAYLTNMTVSDHNPAILLGWDSEALEEFVQAANAEVDGHPPWFSEPRGNISPQSVMNDIVTYLAQLGGGRCDHVLLAPNTLIQYGHLQERLQYMQYDEFMQKCMANVTPGRTLAQTFALTAPTIESAVPTQCLPPPSPVRQIFE